MYGSFNSEIYFLTDDKKIVEPIANYFSEKIFSESDGIFAWILKNNSHDAFFTAKEKFLIVGADKLQTLEKNFVEQFHNICVYKNNCALTFREIQKIYDHKEPRAIFYFENKLNINHRLKVFFASRDFIFPALLFF